MKGHPAMHVDLQSSDEVVKGFQGMSAATRIDLLVRLLHQCLPLEVRFLGMVLQEAALQSYEAMASLESQVNRLASYSDLCSIHDDPKRVCLSLALLRNENNAVATLLSRLLCAEGVVAGCCNACSVEQFEEYRLMYVMALHHPAFCFQDKERRLRSCLGELERALEERMAAQAGVANAEAVVVHGPHVLPMPSSRAQLQQCEVTGLYKRNSDKRFVYSINVVWTDSTEYTIYRPYGEFFTFQSKLLDLFPDEAGGRSKKDRVIPFLPGKRFPFSSHTSKERAEKRFPEIIKYVRALMSLPEHITTHSHVTDFLTPLPQDHFLQDTLFEKIRSLADVQDGDPSLQLERRSYTLTHYSSPSQQAKDKSKTFPHKPAQGDPSTTSPTLATGGGNPPRKVPGTTAASSSPLYVKELERKLRSTELSGIRESPPMPAAERKRGGQAPLDTSPPHCSHDNTDSLVGDSSGDQGSDATPYSTPIGSPSTILRGSATGPLATSATSTPGMNTKPPVSSDALSMVSSVVDSPAPSPSPDMTKRSESCLTINMAESQFSEDSFLHWLKSHRLHKYAAAFRGMTLEQICLLTMEDLLRKGFTLGAAKKFMRQIREWQSHIGPNSLQCLISRHPSTFSLPSYIAERDNVSGVLRSTSSQSLHHQRTTSVTSIQSSLCDGSEAALSEAPVPKAAERQGGVSAQGPAAVVEGSDATSAPPQGEGQVTATPEDSLAFSSNGTVVSALHPSEGVLPPGGPMCYYPEVPPYGYPDVMYSRMPGKPFPPQMGNGIGNLSVPMKGKQERLSPPGVPQQLPPLTAPLGYAYSMLPQAVPVSHYARPGGMPPSQLVPLTQMPNGFVGPHPHLMASQQPLLPQQFSPRPQMVPYSTAPPPTCFRCGQCGHLGQECTVKSMDSFGAPFYRLLEHQPRSPDHSRLAQGHNET